MTTKIYRNPIRKESTTKISLPPLQNTQECSHYPRYKILKSVLTTPTTKYSRVLSLPPLQNTQECSHYPHYKILKSALTTPTTKYSRVFSLPPLQNTQECSHYPHYKILKSALTTPTTKYSRVLSLPPLQNTQECSHYPHYITTCYLFYSLLCDVVNYFFVLFIIYLHVRSTFQILGYNCWTIWKEGELNEI